jgi:hypothetical protein
LPRKAAIGAKSRPSHLLFAAGHPAGSADSPRRERTKSAYLLVSSFPDHAEVKHQRGEARSGKGVITSHHLIFLCSLCNLRYSAMRFRSFQASP